MKKALLFILLFPLLSSLNLIHGQNWAWAIIDSANSDIYNVGSSICLDNTDNVYYTGSLGGNAYFSNCGMQISVGRSAFTAKCDVNGDCSWAGIWPRGSLSYDIGLVIASDHNGNIIETGQIEIDYTHFSVGGIYVIKYKENGNDVWDKIISYAQPTDLSTDGLGNSYLAAYSDGYADTIDSFITGSYDWLAKLDLNGNCKWIKSFPNNVGIWYIKTDSVGNSLVWGADSGTAIIGVDTFRNGPNILEFIAKLDSNGNFLWAKNIWDTSQSTAIYGIAMDKNDNLYSYGINQGPCRISFGCDTLNLVKNGSFVVKFDKNGKCIWDKVFGTYISAIAASPDGTCFIGGSYNDSATIDTFSISGSGIYIAAFDSLGNCKGVQTAIGNADITSIAANNNGNCYITGSVFNSSTFGKYTLSSLDESPYIAKLNSIIPAEPTIPIGSFIVYPNPSNENFTIGISPELSSSWFYLYDITGKKLLLRQLNQQFTRIDIPSLAKGIYLIKLITPDGKMLNKKIVKE